VLVVDDEPHISRIIRTRLEQGPFEVTVAETGTDALAALAADSSIRLLILDLMLPGMSGLDVLGAVRADPRWQGLPCIVLTAASQDAQFRTAQELGASEFMTKPFSPRRLLARALVLVGANETAPPVPADPS
jgi:two-component system, OmpR family, alkaline phosphatase synthesis response regulator PhoP